jgi:hypothetical protein
MNTALLELFKVAGKNDFEFSYKTGEGENVLNLDLDNKKLSLTIGDPEHKDLDLILRDAMLTITGGS